jgi:hypothetical protein
MFTILDHSKFSPSTAGLYDRTAGYYRLGGRSNFTCKQNPTANELRQGIYKPRLTVTKRFSPMAGYDIVLKIEFSAPKMLFGNNFDELTDNDFPRLLSKLNDTLRQMGVYVYEKALTNGPISAIHYSKNIPLTDYTTPYTYIKQLTKVNINKKLDTNQTDYRNEGHSFKYRANTFEVTFYDKLKDLQQAKTSGKRAIEKDNLLQLNLFDRLTKKTPLEVLRMEVRLGSRQKLRQILSKIGLDIDPTFSAVFKQEVAQKVLLHYLKEVEDNYPPLLNYHYNNPKQFFSDFLISNPKTKLSSALKYLAMRVLFEEIGVREFRQLIGRYSNSAWYGLNKDMKNLKRSDDKSIFSLLNESITNYQPLKLLDIQH